MVAFAGMRPRAALVCVLLFAGSLVARADDDGKRQYERSAPRCHGGDGNGGELGPGIAPRLAARTDEELAVLVRDGLPAGHARLPDRRPEARALVAFLRTLRPAPEAVPVAGRSRRPTAARSRA